MSYNRPGMIQHAENSKTGTFKLVIGGELDEYRCQSCGRLLMKGKNLEKSIVEIKCKGCGAIARI